MRRARDSAHATVQAWLWTFFVLSVAAGPSASANVPPAPTGPPVTPPQGTGPGGRFTLQELREFAASVGFPDPITAAAIAMAESKGDPFAQNIVTVPAPGDAPERSFGLWQVNTLAHPEFAEHSLLDPAYNAHAALLLSQSGTNWAPWSTFHPGKHGEPAAYLQFMGASA